MQCLQPRRDRSMNQVIYIVDYLASEDTVVMSARIDWKGSATTLEKPRDVDVDFAPVCCQDVRD